MIEAGGPSTIASIALRLARRPDSLYFHVRALQRAGIVMRSGFQGTGRERAAVYDLPARPTRMVYGQTPAQRERRAGPALDSILRLARRDVRRALKADAVVTSHGPERELWVSRTRGWLSPSQLARANALLHQLSDLFREAPPREGTTPVALAFALTPLIETGVNARRISRPRASKADATTHAS